jgi:hypothetical protein
VKPVRRAPAGLAALTLGLWLAGCGGGGAAARPAVRAQIQVRGHDIQIHAVAEHFDVRAGHFHVQLDGGPVTMFPGPDWVIRDVPPGRHVVVVSLALNDALHTVVAESRQEVSVP